MTPAKLKDDSSATRERLLDAAQALMLAQGFAATSVEDVCHSAKLTKGSFFHYFESKDALGQVLLERFCRTGEQMHQALFGRDADPLTRVYAYIDGMIALSQDPENKGCLMGLFAQELSDTHPAIRKACCEGFEEWAGAFARELAAAKAKHAPKKSFHPKELAEHLVAVMEGSLILGKTRRNMRVIAQNLRHYKAYVKSLYEG